MPLILYAPSPSLRSIPVHRVATGLCLLPFSFAVSCSGGGGEGGSGNAQEPDGTGMEMGTGGMSNENTGGTGGDVSPASGGSPSASGGGTGNGGTGGNTVDPETLGRVDFVAIYETGSLWETNTTARAMVDEVFADFEGTLRTSGDWDATVEVYFTDNNQNNASTGSRLEPTEVDGMTLLVVPAWKKIVQNGTDTDGPAQADGSGADFAIHFNVSPTHESNNGLLRHEMMHGLGAINGMGDILMSPSNTLGGALAGQSVAASLYDLALVDLNGDPLLGAYDSVSETFVIQNYAVEPTYNDWIDGDAGAFFRGIADDGGALDMFIETFPEGDDAALHLAEPFPLMKSGGDVGHPTWDTIEEPDRAFFRAMKYQVANVP